MQLNLPNGQVLVEDTRFPALFNWLENLELLSRPTEILELVSRIHHRVDCDLTVLSADPERVVVLENRWITYALVLPTPSQNEDDPCDVLVLTPPRTPAHRILQALEELRTGLIQAVPTPLGVDLWTQKTAT